MRYWGPINSTNGIFGDDGYVDGNPAIGVQGSIPTFRTFEQSMRELQNLVVSSGLTPDDVMNGFQVTRGIQNGKITYGADSGTANGLVVTLDPAPLGYTAGLKVLVLKGVLTNTGAVTLNINGLGVKDVAHPNGTALIAGDLSASSLLLLGYDGTKFQLVAGGGAGAGAADSFFDLIITVLTTTQAWVVPANVHHMQVEAWAGGGGGGAGNGSFGGGGGGGGEYGLMFLATTPGESLTMTIGAGGNGSASPGNFGVTGGVTTIARGVTQLMSCVGGGGGSPSGSGQQGAAPGQGGTGGNFHMHGWGGWQPDTLTYSSPGGGVALGRGWSLQGNTGLPPGGGAAGNDAANNYNSTQTKGAGGWIKLTYLRG